MIIAPEGPSLRVITQSDHARFAGELLSLWRRDGLPEHRRREPLLFAAREHDNGWWEADAAPRVDPENGQPYDFLSLPTDLRQEIWRRGVSRYRKRHPYGALLILEHALTLHRSHRGDPAWQPLLTSWEQARGEGVEALDEGECLATDYPWISLTDLISLAFCNRRQDPFERHGIRGRAADDTIALSPFPLAGTTTFRIPCRYVPNRPYESDGDFTLTLAGTPYSQAAVRVVRADEGKGVE